MKCRHCSEKLNNVFVDLGFSPISNDMLKEDQLNLMESYYPLKVYVCHKCYLVQLDEFKKAEELFSSDYTYFSSFSKTWIEHTRAYVQMMIERFHFNSDSLVVEIASNDGCLLKNFVEKEIPVLGIEPTANTAKRAIENGVESIVEFFSTELAKKEFVDKERGASLIVGNNVLAHVPDINDFVYGMKQALDSDGIITMEFPHLSNLIKDCQFDTIYHEHFSYLSLIAVKNIFKKFDLEIFDVDEISTHGGSLRIYAKHKECQKHKISEEVNRIIEREIKEGLTQMNFYKGFMSRVNRIKNNALRFLIDAENYGQSVAAYGAASKGNTLINYCGLKGNDLIKFVVDASPYKQNKFLPGSHIPVVDESRLKEEKPDYVIILPWNLTTEIETQLDYIKNWGGKLVTFIPELRIF
ncbi:class I SAM-dependent methyltransferase [Lutimonas saemankumensis]|uniref:class I SAM-dependent methyltransferase n=1 Tax=Lutimonas saemankumensis TaxID=483016 RepID=UPI001CD7FBFE|nr:class I SAM-dependent methyltransferase [Lutimonas saemankumensis]MCA0931053.1 class I SAM-dependent methyltransferase [Lutimonas saemankumensis]